MIKENFIQLFADSFKKNWELKALSDYVEKTSFTYGEVATEVAKLHMLFEACHIKQGDKIALIGRNTSSWCIVYMATITYGAVIVPILPDFNPNDVHHIVSHSDSVLLFTTDQIWESLEEEKLTGIKGAFSLTDFRCIYQKDGETIQKFMAHRAEEFKKKYPNGYHIENINYAKRSNKELALISYTSGTTGFSKGVMLSANNLAGNTVFGLTTNLYSPGDNCLCFLPLAHAYGCAFDFLTPINAGAHITLLSKIPTPKILLKAFEEIKPKLICMVPLILEKIYKKQILPKISSSAIKLLLNVPFVNEKIYSKIRETLVQSFGSNFSQIIVGGAPLNKEVEEFLYKIKFPFTVGYGMTECAPLISYSRWDNFIPTSAGMVLHGYMEVKIDSEDPYNKVGEIMVRGEHVMMGYYKNPEATAAIMKDGWLLTGDMGKIDTEGNIFIRGRSKSMILGASGQNIYPEEIEAKLNNMPCVMESLVIDRNGKLVALVYPDYDGLDGVDNTQEVLPAIMDENRKNLNKIVAPYEQISAIELYPNEFEKTPKKSIKRYLYQAH
ncbi:MAG: AMP-binding protein [Bacteroidales bacterium]